MNDRKHRFIKFDLNDVYLIIHRNTLLKVLTLAKNYCTIDKDEINTEGQC